MFSFPVICPFTLFSCNPQQMSFLHLCSLQPEVQNFIFLLFLCMFLYEAYNRRLEISFNKNCLLFRHFIVLLLLFIYFCFCSFAFSCFYLFVLFGLVLPFNSLSFYCVKLFVAFYLTMLDNNCSNVIQLMKRNDRKILKMFNVNMGFMKNELMF